MNERIKELIEECTSHIENMDGDWDEYFAKEKFAQLIVRECAKKCEFIAVQAEITNTGEMARKTKATADSCAKMIKQHFGVEE
jgi:hypothetical protein